MRDIMKMFFIVQRKRNFLVVRVRRVQSFAGQQFDSGSRRRERLRRSTGTSWAAWP